MIERVEADDWLPPAVPAASSGGVATASASSWWEAERERLPLWIPVPLAAGVGLFFSLPFDPFPGAAAALAALLLAAAWWSRARSVAVVVAVASAAAALGFTAAEIRVAVVGTPMLERERGPLPVTGRLVEVERTADGHRLTVAEPVVEGLAAADTPRAVRLRLAGRWRPPALGALIVLRARLLPPSAPVAPGAFDFQRHAFFDGIGAVGFVTAEPEVVAPPPDGGGGFAVMVETVRERITARVAAALDGPAAAVTAALMDGERSAIPEDTLRAMRDSGLAHLLSISGLHIGLVAGIVFFATRAALALIPPLALRLPLKKIAAVAGLVAAVAYTILVGAPVPTVRASIMTGLALVAVMAGRDPFSMRLVAVAAVLVLAWAPESLVGPSFQMSFAAVVALIAVYEVAAPAIARLRPGLGPPLRAALHVASLALTSAVASLATAPFAAYHFQTVAILGVIANLVAVPLTATVVMPALLAAYALMPLGWDGPALSVAGWGVEGIVAAAEWTAGLPGAVIPVPAMPAWALAVAALGGCWLSIWRRPRRWWGALPIVLGMATAWLTPRPDLLVDGEGRLVAVRLADDRLSLSTARAARFAAENWRRLDGEPVGRPEERPPFVWPAWGASPDGSLRCDPEACVHRPTMAGGGGATIIRRAAALGEECRRAGGEGATRGAAEGVMVIVAPELTLRECGDALIIDRRRLNRLGAHAIRFLAHGPPRISTVAETRGDRPWSRSPGVRSAGARVTGGRDTEEGAKTAGASVTGASAGDAGARARGARTSTR